MNASSPAWAAAAPLVLAAAFCLTLSLAGLAPPYWQAWFFCGLGVMLGEGFTEHAGACAAACASALVAVAWPERKTGKHRGKHRNDERETR